MTTERIAITNAERLGGLTLLFGGQRVTLYGSYSLGSSLQPYLSDAKGLGLALNEEEADFRAFDEGPDCDAVLKKIEAGGSWGPAHATPPSRPPANEPPANRQHGVEVASLVTGKSVKKKRAERGAKGGGGAHGRRGKRAGRHLRAAEGNAKDAKRRSLRERATKHGSFHQTKRFSVVTDALHGSTGWQGREPHREERTWVLKAYESGEIKKALAHFYPVPCDLDSKHPTCLFDIMARAFFFRTAPARWLATRVDELCRAHVGLLADALSSPREAEGSSTNSRGPHLACVLGHYRQYSREPYLTSWHRDHAEAVEDYLQTPIIQTIIKWVTSVHWLAFPGVASRTEKSFDWHFQTYGIKPLFGLFWNLCINSPFAGQKRVHCKPHCDSKNIIGVCGVLVYVLRGVNFNHKARSWLVLWEAGVIIELPPWVLVLYPSSLFFHFNIDIHDIEFVVTEDGSKPTPQNSRPIVVDGDEQGRGSMVFFNEATMFYGPETGHPTLKETRGAGGSGRLDFGQVAQAAFEKFAVKTTL